MSVQIKSIKVFLIMGILMMGICSISAQNNHMHLYKTYTGEFNGQEFGWRVITMDFNGDGFDDLITSVPSVNTGSGSWSASKIWFFFGTETGLPDTANIVIESVPGFSAIGDYIVNLGDMNGDGCEELGFHHSHKVNDDYWLGYIDVLLGNNIGNIVPEIQIPLPYHFNQSQMPYIKNLGDINGDGLNDAGVIICKDLNSVPSMLEYDYYLLYGNEWILNYLCMQSFTQSVGTDINGVGDVNLDGKDDFIIGYPPDITGYTHNMYLYYGSTEIDSIPDLVLNDYVNVNYLNSYTGFRCGDWNGDGYEDFIGTCSNYEGAGIWLSWDPMPLHPSTFLEYYGFVTEQFLGYGDLNNDGKSDIAIGLPWFENYSGRVYLYLGGGNGSCDLILENPANWDANFGLGITCGDYNNDGYDDLAVSAPGIDEEYFPGKIFIYLGSSQLHETTQGIEDNTAPVNVSEFSTYPNPFNPVLNFNLKEPPQKDMKMSIYNVKGERVKVIEIKDRKFSWKTDILASGIYFCKLTQNNVLLDMKKVTLIR